MAGIKMKMLDSDKLNVFLDNIIGDVEITEEEVLKKMRPRVTAIAVEELKKYKRLKLPVTKKSKRTKHMFQDVSASIVKDEYGYMVLRVRGGKHTGTLWHLLNDGTFSTPPTHFMDKITDKIDKEFQTMANDILHRRF